MKTLFLLPVALILAAASTAAAQDVRYNFDNKADFASFKTYKWVALKGAPPLSDLVDKQIKESVDAELARKGLKKATGDEADLFIGYQSAVDKEKQYTSYDTGWGYGSGWYGGGWYGGGGMTTTTGQTSTILVGQLALDMYSPAPKTLVWRGFASKTLDAKAKPDKQKKNLDKAVAKLLKNFPPPAPKK
jgi:uncharacterized protein DUF4136